MAQSAEYPIHFLKNHFLYQNVKSQSIKKHGVGGFHMLCMSVRLCTHENQMIKSERRSKLFRVHTLFLNKMFRDFSRTFKDRFPIFPRSPFSAKTRLESVFFGSSTTWAILSWRSFCVCSFFTLENLGWIKLQSVAKMLRHSHEKTTIFASNHC